MLTLLGARLHARHITRIQSVTNYLQVGRWFRDCDFRIPPRKRTRIEVWDEVRQGIGERKVLYLEFGVAAGDSMRYWSAALRHPDAALHGFDSFEGLPEDGAHWRKGQFDRGGRIPEINDPRVRFHKGWFNETLTRFIVPQSETLVLNMDADLYSSTAFVLNYLAGHIRPGTLIYFDEMNQPDHELRAFDEFIRTTRARFRVVAADRSLTHVLFECTERPAPNGDQ
jgi:hypothetical protein